MSNVLQPDTTVAIIFGAIVPVIFTIAVSTTITLGWHRPKNMLWQLLMSV